MGHCVPSAGIEPWLGSASGVAVACCDCAESLVESLKEKLSFGGFAVVGTEGPVLEGGPRPLCFSSPQADLEIPEDFFFYPEVVVSVPTAHSTGCVEVDVRPPAALLELAVAGQGGCGSLPFWAVQACEEEVSSLEELFLVVKAPAQVGPFSFRISLSGPFFGPIPF